MNGNAGRRIVFCGLPRLSEVRCPTCRKCRWIIDRDRIWIDGVFEPYAARAYACADCGGSSVGWTVTRQAPEMFLWQPNDSEPMTRAEFDYWLTILWTYFPSHPRLKEAATMFYPSTPRLIRRAREIFIREHPVAEMRDQDGARRRSPTSYEAVDWVDMMGSNDTLTFTRFDGGQLLVSSTNARMFAVRCIDASSELVGLPTVVDRYTLATALALYVEGDVSECVRHICRRAP